MLKKVSEIFQAVEIITTPKGVDSLGFSSRPFVLTSFPIKKQTGKLTWKRTNGNATLSITVPEGKVIPYGAIDRLIPIFLASIAVKTQSRIINFDRTSDILDFFGLSLAGSNYKRILPAINRVFSATVFFEIKSNDKTSVARFNFISSVSLFKKDPEKGQERLPGIAKNSIILSQEFFDEVRKHPIPLDLDIVKLLRNKPLSLDVYSFLAYKAAVVKSPTKIGLDDLAEAFGSSDLNVRKIRQSLKRIIPTISKVAKLNVKIADNAVVIGPAVRP